MTNERERWNDRYRDRDGNESGDPIPALADRIDQLPDGRALDVATGTGRNALFLAANGYDVDAVDVSDVAIERARERAESRGLDVNWMRADLADFDLKTDAYDVITVSYFAALDHLPALKDALASGGVLVYEHHLQSSDPVTGPSTDRYRYRSNDLLQACLDLTILSYEERRRPDRDGHAAIVTLVGRKTTGGSQSYPVRPD